LPCRATGCLSAVCACLLAATAHNRLHPSICTSLRCPPAVPCLALPCLVCCRPACLRVLAASCCCCYSTLNCCYHYYSSPPNPPAYPPNDFTLIHSQPAIPKVSRRLPASHRIRPKLQSSPDQTLACAHPSLARPACLPSRGPSPASLLSFYVGRRRATPCALGNHLRTTCGTCRPRGRSRLGRRSGPQCAGQTEYQSLDELPDHTHSPSNRCPPTGLVHSQTDIVLCCCCSTGPRTSRRMRTVSTVSHAPPNPMPPAAVTASLHAAAAASSHLTSLHLRTLPNLVHVLTRPALCIRCRHWRLCPRFLPGLRRQQPILAL